MVDIGTNLVTALIANQFPMWTGLAVTAVEPGGWDNRTFRLGPELSVRLPSHARYVAQVAKEHRWLPVLAPSLPLPIPSPVAMGRPGEGYPWAWSVYRWIDGTTATSAEIADASAFARDLAHFLHALYQVDATDGPAAGAHNFHRGGQLAVYDREVRDALPKLIDRARRVQATSVWERALESTWERPGVWVHGDIAAGNLLVRDGRLAAVIDFGSSGVGDPACDLTITWTLFRGAGRAAFRDAIAIDDSTWARARGWALWKALITIFDEHSSPRARREARRVLGEVLGESFPLSL